MDPLVFSISTASSAPGSGAPNGIGTISEHPGDTAPPLKVIELLYIASYGAVSATAIFLLRFFGLRAR